MEFQIFLTICTSVFIYLFYPIFIAAVIVFFIHFAINMCSPLIIKLIGDIGIENQCNKIRTKGEELDD